MNQAAPFNESNLPYDKLALVGITQEGINAMPQLLRDAIFNGDKTPLIEARMITANGRSILVPLRIQITRDQNGKQLMLVFPVHKEQNRIPNLTNQEHDTLLSGNVIVKTMGAGSSRKPYFLQLDPETNFIIRKSLDEVAVNNRIADVERINHIQLGTEQKKRVRDGKPVELNVGDETVVVGVDLREPQHFRTLNGDMKEWERQRMIKYDLDHPEYMGFVQTDANRWEYAQVMEAQRLNRRMSMGNHRGQATADGLKL